MTTLTLSTAPTARTATTGTFVPAVRPGVSAGHPGPRAAVAAGPRPVRLTRRGRVVVVLALLLGLLVAGFVLGHVGGSQAAGSAPAQTVVVQPGDTLWSIAARVAPDRDPRGVVARLSSLNHLQGAQLRVGERLVLPA